MDDLSRRRTARSRSAWRRGAGGLAGPVGRLDPALADLLADRTVAVRPWPGPHAAPDRRSTPRLTLPS